MKIEKQEINRTENETYAKEASEEIIRKRDKAHGWFDKDVLRFIKKYFEPKWGRRLLAIYYALCWIESDFCMRNKGGNQIHNLQKMVGTYCCKPDRNIVNQCMQILKALHFIYYGKKTSANGRIIGSEFEIFPFVGKSAGYEKYMPSVNQLIAKWDKPLKSPEKDHSMGGHIMAGNTEYRRTFIENNSYPKNENNNNLLYPKEDIDAFGVPSSSYSHFPDNPTSPMQESLASPTGEQRLNNCAAPSPTGNDVPSVPLFTSVALDDLSPNQRLIAENWLGKIKGNGNIHLNRPERQSSIKKFIHAIDYLLVDHPAKNIIRAIDVWSAVAFASENFHLKLWHKTLYDLTIPYKGKKGELVRILEKKPTSRLSREPAKRRGGAYVQKTEG